MSEIKLTEQQKIAVTVSGNAMLVSAAAGSGKTMVLVQRLMDKICNDKINADITDFLIITYTRAAASELKSRVLKEINRRISENPHNRHLRRQALLCMKAHISTIHGFCAELIRENSQHLDISPDFRVADESECVALKDMALERVLNEKYDNIMSDSEFRAFADLMSDTRGDKKLIEAVLDAYEKLRSHPSPNQWMKSQETLLGLEEVSDLSETVWGREIMEHARNTTDYCINRMERAYEEIIQYPDMLKAYGSSFCTSIDSMKEFKAALDVNWDSAYEKKNILFPTARVKGYDDIKAIRTKCKDIMKKESELFDGPSYDMLDDMRSVAAEARGLYSVLRSFDAAYTAEKRKRGIVDFSDQEHLALELLYDFENNCPTEIAKSVASRFCEIMVDEYQDVNAVQEMIFSSVSQNKKNLFMVGDVKQSIYRFRMADPTIFLNKYLEFTDYENGTDAQFKVLLPTNFRSEKGILDAVNYIFAGIMSRQFGEMDYTKREYLKPRDNIPENSKSCIEYDILDVGDDDTIDKIAAEAEFIASRIYELVESGTEIYDNDKLRPLKYEDFAILLRSLKNRAWQYAAALERLGIPADIPTGESFFEAYEVSLMISFLSIIDNPRQDIPLIAVLTSPIYRFSPDELVEIRTKDRKSTIYDALLVCADTNKKCAEFVEDLKYFRAAAVNVTADKLVWMIYSKKGIVELCCASEGGEDSQNNLFLIAELARKFEITGYKGLFRFVNQLKSMMASGTQVAGESKRSGGVRIMSIHKSKGLEFPVVILADTTHKFNLQDVTKPILFHSQLGTGLYKRDNKRRIKYPTIARKAVSRRIISETLSEELRVLYVALTRGKNKLILVSSVRDSAKELQKYWPGGEYPFSPTVLEGVKNYAGWLFLTALSRPESSSVFTPDIPQYNNSNDEKWDIRLIKYTPAADYKKRDTASTNIPEIAATDEIPISENLEFIYPYQSSVGLPSKLTATELKGRAVDKEISENAEPTIKKRAKLRRPDFNNSDKKMTGSEKGTALHQAMQYINYNACTDVNNINIELTRLVKNKFITEKQAQTIEPVKIANFFSSELGMRLLKSKNVKREFKFSLLIPADELISAESEDEILFQGVIDCYFEEPDGIIVLDFKTDYINDFNFQDKIQQYSAQIQSYAMAIKKITGKKVKSAALYFFSNEQTVEIL